MPLKAFTERLSQMSDNAIRGLPVRELPDEFLLAILHRAVRRKDDAQFQAFLGALPGGLEHGSGASEMMEAFHRLRADRAVSPLNASPS